MPQSQLRYSDTTLAVSPVMQWNHMRNFTGETHLEKLNRDDTMFFKLTCHDTGDSKGGDGATAIWVDPVAP